MNVAHASFGPQEEIQAVVTRLYTELYNHRQAGAKKSLSMWLGLIAEVLRLVSEHEEVPEPISFGGEDEEEDGATTENQQQQQQQTRAKNSEDEQQTRAGLIITTATCVLALCCLLLRFFKGR